MRRTRLTILSVSAAILVASGCATMNALRTAQSMAQVDDAPSGLMRAQLRAAGTPEAEIDQAIKQVDEKMKAEGVPQAQRDYVMLQRRRPVNVHLQWQMDVQAQNARVTYPCDGRDFSGDFVCRYRVEGRVTVPGTLDYVPLSETERILREMGEIPALGPKGLGLLPSPSQEAVSVSGECRALGRPQNYCGVSTLPFSRAEGGRGSQLTGIAKMTDHGSTIEFSGTLFDASLFGVRPPEENGSVPQNPKSLKGAIGKMLKKEVEGNVLGAPDSPDDSVPVSQVRSGIDPEAARADYRAFLRQLFETGHSRHRFRWSEPVEDTGGESRNALVQAEFDVELKGGPAPEELKPPAR